MIAAFGGEADIVGHSMGGKAAMMLTLRHPCVRRLVVADIAPVGYSHTQIGFIQAMRGVDLEQVNRRSDAEAQLAHLGVDKALQSFFTQSLDVTAKRWRLNLAALEQNMPAIMSFPPVQSIWTGAALFLSGSASDYVTREHRPHHKGPVSRRPLCKNSGRWPLAARRKTA